MREYSDSILLSRHGAKVAQIEIKSDLAKLSSYLGVLRAFAREYSDPNPDISPAKTPRSEDRQISFELVKPLNLEPSRQQASAM